jgi:hypothetical protein
MKSKHPVMTDGRRAVLSYVRANPGCSKADIDRACRTARKGHAWMYAMVDRMLGEGMLVRVAVREESRRGNAQGIAVAAEYTEPSPKE